jgi:Ser/Thr protein kinase RdoA (MazF antagonist)
MGGRRPIPPEREGARRMPEPAPSVMFDETAFLSALSPVLSALVGVSRATVIGRATGNINLVLKLDCGGRVLGVRIALNRHRLRYERGPVKEVFAAAFLLALADTRGEGANEAVERERRVVETLLARPTGSLVDTRWVRPILWYDWSETLSRFPYFLFEWVEGQPLWRRPSPAAYARAGADLARLHRVGFRHFYADLFSIGRQPQSWSDRFRAAWSRELAEAASALPPAVTAGLAAFPIEAVPPGLPCLVHNDYSGANLLVASDGAVRAIDWDNWVVDCAELDLVKMKYWTALGRTGRLRSDATLYAAFRGGYDQWAARPVDELRLAAYERLWLLRVFNFERARAAESARPSVREEGEAWRPVYPAAAAYAARLATLSGSSLPMIGS